jgi:hypothetical protein
MFKTRTRPVVETTSSLAKQKKTLFRYSVKPCFMHVLAKSHLISDVVVRQQTCCMRFLHAKKKVLLASRVFSFLDSQKRFSHLCYFSMKVCSTVVFAHQAITFTINRTVIHCHRRCFKAKYTLVQGRQRKKTRLLNVRFQKKKPAYKQRERW